MGNDQSKRPTKEGEGNASPGGRRRRFECRVVLCPSSSDANLLIRSSGTDGDGAATIELTDSHGGEGPRTFRADGAFGSPVPSSADGGGGYLQNFYSKHLLPGVEHCTTDGTNLLLWTCPTSESKMKSLHGPAGGLAGLVCGDIFNSRHQEKDAALTLSLLCSPADPSADNGAYDCLVAATPPGLLSVEELERPTEVTVRTLDEVGEVVERGRQVVEKVAGGGGAHTLLVVNVRQLSDSGDVVGTRWIKILDLGGSIGGARKPQQSEGGRGNGRNGRGGEGRGGRAGRKGGRGWKSYDTRKAAAASEEDRTTRAVRRIVDYLSRRFKNVPYDDSAMTALVRSGFEPGSHEAKSIAIFYFDGNVEETVAALEFMEKVRGVTVPEG